MTGRGRSIAGFASVRRLLPRPPVRAWTAAWIADPYPHYERWRERSPVLVSGPRPELAPSWLVLRHDQVLRVLRDHETFSSRWPEGGLRRKRRAPGLPGLRGWIRPRHAGAKRAGTRPTLPLIGEDPPVHTQHRRLVQPALSQRAAAALTPWIEEEVHRLLDTWPGDDADAVEHLTARLTAAVAGRVLGIPREDQPRFHRWAEDYFDDTTGQGIRATTEQQMLRLLDQLLGQDRAEDGGGLFATLASSGAEAGLDRPLVLALALVVAVAAHETTSYLIASMLNALAHHPAAWELLRTGPEHIERVVEETLRRESPAQVLHRRVVRDVEMDGVVLRAGERVAVSFGAANRDPGVFTRPAEFLPQREEGPHLAFGIGVHACPGAPLARAQAAAVLRVLLERGWRPAPGSRPGTRQVRTSRLLGFSSLPLRFER